MLGSDGFLRHLIKVLGKLCPILVAVEWVTRFNREEQSNEVMPSPSKRRHHALSALACSTRANDAAGSFSVRTNLLAGA